MAVVRFVSSSLTRLSSIIVISGPSQSQQLISNPRLGSWNAQSAASVIGYLHAAAVLSWCCCDPFNFVSFSVPPSKAGLTQLDSDFNITRRTLPMPSPFASMLLPCNRICRTQTWLSSRLASPLVAKISVLCCDARCHLHHLCSLIQPFRHPAAHPHAPPLAHVETPQLRGRLPGPCDYTRPSLQPFHQ